MEIKMKACNIRLPNTLIKSLTEIGKEGERNLSQIIRLLLNKAVREIKEKEKGQHEGN